MELHIIELDADVIDINIQLFLGLDNLSKFRVLLDVGNDTITSLDKK